jgi:hypothetical protein
VGYTKKIKAGLVQQDYTQFVGEPGTLFYNYDNGTLRLSDGVTPGGTAVNLIGDFNDIAIGNITVDGTTISPNSPNTDLNIVATGTGVLHLTTPIEVNKVSIDGAKILTVKDDGQVKIIVETADAVEGAVGIVGNATGAYQSPVQTGVMLHITGQQNDVSRTYLDGVNNYAILAGRRYNGTPDAPTQVLAEQPIMRFGCNAYNGTAWNTGGVARIQMVASEDHTPTAAGTRLEFWSTPNGTTTNMRQGYYDGNGLTAINLTTTGLLNATNANITTSQAVLTVSANADGLTKIPVLGGTIAQFTNKDNIAGAVLIDGYGTSSGATVSGKLVFRTARGTNASPAAVQANDVIGKVAGAGWGTTGYGGVDAASLIFKATQTFTDTARGTKAVISLTPDGSNTPQDYYTFTTTQLTVPAGGTVSGRLRATAGTTSEPSIQLEAGPLPTVSSPGGISYNGITLYAVPQDGEIGVIPAEQHFVLNAVRNLTPGTTAAQSVLGKTVHLSANTRYCYVLKFQLYKNGAGSNTPTINFGLGLTNGATLFAHGYNAFSNVGASGGAQAAIGTVSQMANYITTGFSTGVPISAAMGANASWASCEIRGYIGVNTAGTVDFQIAFSDAPNTSCNIQPTASCRIYPVALSGVDTSVGTWA